MFNIKSNEEDVIRREAARKGYGDHRMVCPYCSGERTKKNVPCLSYKKDEDAILYRCHHCDRAGRINTSDTPVRAKEYRPMAVIKPMQTADLTDKAVEWLASRSISAETARKFNVKSTTYWTNELQRESECVAFPYTNKDRVYAVKIRSIEGKAFSQNGSCQTLFGSDIVTDWSTLVLCEGEMDALAMTEAGIDSAVSIPGGAVMKPTDSDGKFAFIRHAEDQLKNTKKVIIATDDDEPGKATAEEIARRLGRDRCWRVVWPEGCKDANDVLVKLGKQALVDAVKNAKPWPVDGLYAVSTFYEQVVGFFNKGLSKGESTGYPALDRLYTIAPGLTVVTGHPSSGKSELVDQLMMNLARREDWSFAVCSFENPPEFHITKLVQKYVGKPFFGNYNRMAPHELELALEFVNNHFTFVHQIDGSLSTLESILERLKVAVMRHGIRGAVIDPYNYINKSRDSSETDWIADMLSKVRAFAMAHGLHIWFVAHPTKMARSADGDVPVPKGYDISGSAAWFAKADVGLTVHRPDRINSNVAQVHVWKVRFNWLGREGEAELAYRSDMGSYVDPTDPMIVAPF